MSFLQKLTLFIFLKGIPQLTLPQMAETNTPRLMDVHKEHLLYHVRMTRVYVADAKLEERAALRLLLRDLQMEVVGEAADWATTLAKVPANFADMLLIDWDVLPVVPTAALDALRKACPASMVIVLLSHLDARQQVAFSISADAFINKGDTPERVAESLRAAVADTVRL